MFYNWASEQTVLQYAARKKNMEVGERFYKWKEKP